jgi:putative ABC transport system permease protein
MMLATLLITRLRSHMGRSLVLVLVIAVASGVALGALAVLRVADDPRAELVKATNGGDIEIRRAPVRPDPQMLAAMPEVAQVGVLIESGYAALQTGRQTLQVDLERMPGQQTMRVDRPLMLTGRWVQSGDEVVLEASLANALGLQVGDQVTLSGQDSRPVRVVGTAATWLTSYPEYIPGTVFAGSDLYDAIDPVGGPWWSIGMRLHDPSRAEAVAARLNKAGPVPASECGYALGWCANTMTSIRDESSPFAAQSAQLMLFFAVLMLIAALLLIVTLLGSRLVSEARELTLLQVAGLTPAQMALLIAAEHAVLAAVGVAAGALIGTTVAPQIAESAATALGSVSPNLSLEDILRVAGVAIIGSALVSGVGGWRAGRRSLAIVARGGSGRVHRSRAAALALAATSRTTLALGLKDISTRRGRTTAILLSVGLAVTIAVTVVGLSSLKVVGPGTLATPASELPADPAAIADLSGLPSTVSGELVDRFLTLITTLQVLLGGVALVTLLAASSMSIRERLRELGVLHAIGCSRLQLVGASAISQGVLGVVGTLIGVPLGLGVYLLFRQAAAGTVQGGLPSPALLTSVAIAAVAVAAATAIIPAMLAQRLPTSEALAAE